MIIQRAYKTKLRPTAIQRRYLSGCCGAARFIYNWALADRKEMYESGGKPNKYEQKKRFNATKDAICPWIRQYPYKIIDAEFDHVDNAYQNFFRRIKQGITGKEAGYPKFKKRGLKNSFALRGSIKIERDQIRLPIIGWINLAENGYLPENGTKINSVTVSEYVGDWFVSIQVEEEQKETIPLNGHITGIDVGIKSLAVLSDGRTFNNPKTLDKYQKKLTRLSKELARRKKGGANRRKTKEKIAKLHRKIQWTRRHVQHDISRAVLSDGPAAVALEDLNVKGMMKNHHLARAISDSGFGELRRQIEYKAEWINSEVIIIDRWYASSKTCSACGCIKEDLTLADRIYRCDECGLEIDRDLNAAKNIAAYGERVKRAGLPVELDGLPSTEKQEGGT